MQIFKDSNNASNQTNIKVINQVAEPINFLNEINVFNCNINELENIITIIGVKNKDDLDYFNSLKNNANNISDRLHISTDKIKLYQLENLVLLNHYSILSNQEKIDENLTIAEVEYTINTVKTHFNLLHLSQKEDSNVDKSNNLEDNQNTSLNSKFKKLSQEIIDLKKALGIADTTLKKIGDHNNFTYNVIMAIMKKREEIVKDLDPIKAIEGSLSSSNLDIVSKRYKSKLKLVNLDYTNISIEELEYTCKEYKIPYESKQFEDIKEARNTISDKLNIKPEEIKSKHLESFLIIHLKKDVQYIFSSIYEKAYNLIKLFKLSNNKFDEEITRTIDLIQYYCYKSNYIADAELYSEDLNLKFSKKELKTDEFLQNLNKLVQFFKFKNQEIYTNLINYGNFVKNIKTILNNEIYNIDSTELEPVKIRKDVFNEIFKYLKFKILKLSEKYKVTKEDFKHNKYFGLIHIDSNDANYYTIKKCLFYKYEDNQISICNCDDTIGIFSFDEYIYEDLNLSLNSKIANRRQVYIFDLISKSKLNSFEKFILFNIYKILDESLISKLSPYNIEGIIALIKEQIHYLPKNRDTIFSNIEKILKPINETNTFDIIRSLISEIFEHTKKNQTNQTKHYEESCKWYDDQFVKFIMFPNPYFRYNSTLINYHFISIHMFNEIKAILEFDHFLNKLGLRIHPFNNDILKIYYDMYGVDRHYNFIRKSELESKFKYELNSDSGKELIELLKNNTLKEFLNPITNLLSDNNKTYINQYDEFYSLYKKLDKETNSKFHSNQNFIIKFPKNCCPDQPILNWLIERYKRDCIKEPKTNAEKAFNIYLGIKIYMIIYEFGGDIPFLKKIFEEEEPQQNFI
ncbi:MAG: hypothetical protein N4A49_02470 [Marinifilaceae bacterium]|jgi:hypothetical protein|nr:hypothetical protein [Marinifilaceae bacterium]